MCWWGLSPFLKCVCSHWKRKEHVSPSKVEILALVQHDRCSDYKGKTSKCPFHVLLQHKAECQHKGFPLYFLGSIVPVSLCEKCTYKGRFGKSRALGVVADLKSAGTVVKILAWALQEALGRTLDTSTCWPEQCTLGHLLQTVSQPSTRPPVAHQVVGSGARLLVVALSQYRTQPVLLGCPIRQHGSQEFSSDTVPPHGFISGKEMFAAAAFKHDFMLTIAVEYSILNTQY